MQGGPSVLSWLHIGDLHITAADQQNYKDLRRIVDLARNLPAGSLDFTVLPGDNADDGEAAQFRLVRDAVAPLGMTLHVLAGDHDYKPRTLDAFHAVLAAETLPKAVRVRGHRCLFLDVVSAGTGGPDFRVGPEQIAWIERELEQAQAAGENVAIFMHTYPADLREGGDRLGALLARPSVTCVDMGHTHYNELANDGHTIFMATRSTGQIEEGPPGFSIAAVDDGVVSWRFKPLDRAWPFVLVTHPADRRLATASSERADGSVVRAKVLGDLPIDAVSLRVDDGDWAPMAAVSEAAALWQGVVGHAGRSLTVRVRDARGREDEDRVEIAVDGRTATDHAADGSDRDRIGAWSEKGILGTQLGPNRNGRKW